MKSIPQTIRMALAVIVLAFLHGLTVHAATLLVWQGSPSPTPPYGTWATSATNIQDAIDAANAGDEVVVTNGVYATGGRIVAGAGGTNRVAVDKSITVRSVNGPTTTIISGQFGAESFGFDSVRCVYLTNGATLSGMTLTNGQTLPYWDGGGAWCASTNVIITNCVLAGNWAYSEGGGAYQGTILDCTLSNNVASLGGGVSQGVISGCLLSGNDGSTGGGADRSWLTNCVLTRNLATTESGGAAGCILIDCVLTYNSANRGGGVGASFANDRRGSILTRCKVLWNTAQWSGGGARESTFFDCEVSHNSAYGFVEDSINGGGAISCYLENCLVSTNSALNNGGGAYGCHLENCRIMGNTANDRGGGASHSSLGRCQIIGNSAEYGGGIDGEGDEGVVNCLIANNAAVEAGGGSYECALVHCTVVGNSADIGGGVAGGALTNCIVYFNSASSNANFIYSNSFPGDPFFWAATPMSYCASFPLPTNGVGNITNAPLFADATAGDYHLRPESPCIDAGVVISYLPHGFNSFLTDLDGKPRPVAGPGHTFARYDMGAYEFLLQPASTDPVHFTFQSLFGVPNLFVNSVYVAGHHAFLAGGRMGLTILNVGDPTHPFLLGQADTGGFAYDVEVAGQLAYVADFYGGLRIFDVGNPAAPTLVGSVDTRGCAESSHALRVVGSLAYLAGGSPGLQVIDVSNPAHPVRVGSADIDSSAQGVEVVGNRVYVDGLKRLGGDDTASFLQIFDCTQPTNLVSLGRLENEAESELIGLAVGNGLVYTVGGAFTLGVIDVANPLDPMPAGQFTTAPAWSQAIQLVADRAYVAGEYFGLMALEVSDPTHPEPLGQFKFGFGEDEGWGIHVVGRHAYLARGSNGLLIFEINEWPPRIDSISRSGTNVVISWQATPDLKLQRTASLTSPDWTDVPVSVGTNMIHMSMTSSNAFFRLVKP